MGIAKRIAWAVSVVPLMLLVFDTALAEPYLAISKGMQCSGCHSHPAGGGKRNVYGNAFGQSELPSARIGDNDMWTGEITKWLSIGGNLRACNRYIDTPNTQETSEFVLSRATLYIEANLIPGRLSFVIDQQVAPNASINREAYVRLNSNNRKFFLLAGQCFLPYGLRLQDDSAFVRLATGINFTNPDRGVQIGFESGSWSTIASITNGNGGGPEVDTGKQLSAVSTFVQSRWRTGISVNINDAATGDREMFGLFGGLKTGPIVWLAELDRIMDDIAPGVSRDAFAGLLEANWMPRKGHNLKISYDVLDPDDNISGDRQTRIRLIWEHTPVQFLQARVGLRRYAGIKAVNAQNRDIFFAELHGYF